MEAKAFKAPESIIEMYKKHLSNDGKDKYLVIVQSNPKDIYLSKTSIDGTEINGDNLILVSNNLDTGYDSTLEQIVENLENKKENVTAQYNDLLKQHADQEINEGEDVMKTTENLGNKAKKIAIYRKLKEGNTIDDANKEGEKASVKAKEIYTNKMLFGKDKPDHAQSVKDALQESGTSDIYTNTETITKYYKDGNVVTMIPETAKNNLFNKNKFIQFIKKYKISDSGGGGNCLFLSIAKFLRKKYGSTLNHEEVRKLILEKETELYESSKKSDKDTVMGISLSQMKIQQRPIGCKAEENDFITKNVNGKKPKNLLKPEAYLRCMSTDGVYGTELEIAVSALVDWPISNDKKIRLNFHIIKTGMDGTDCGKNAQDCVLYTSFITQDGVSDVLIYHTGKVQDEEDITTGKHYQTFLPDKDIPFEEKKVPFIDWELIEKPIHLSDVKTKGKPPPKPPPPPPPESTSPPPPPPPKPPTTPPPKPPTTTPPEPEPPPKPPPEPESTPPKPTTETTPTPPPTPPPTTPPTKPESDGPSCALVNGGATSSSSYISTDGQLSQQLQGGIRPRQAQILKKESKKKSKISKKSNNKSKKR